MSKLANIYLIASLGTSLNKGVLKDFSFFSFLFFWACAPKREVTCRKERQKNRPHRVVSSFLSICGADRACGGSS